MSISVGPSAAAAAGYAGNAYGAASAAPKSAPPTDSTDTSSSSSTNVTLSDEAKAYLAAHADEAKAYLAAQAADDPPSMATLTTNARAWFDQQYASLGISSAMLDGQVAVDLSSQTRATLSAVATNAQSQFTTDEATAAAKAQQARFDDAMAPHVVIARHTGDYASLYAAASDYLDSAGADEKSTPPGKIRSRRCWKGSPPPRPISARRRSRTMTTIRLDRSSLERRCRRLLPPVQARTRCPPARARCSMRKRAAPEITARSWFSTAAGKPGNRWISPSSTTGRWRSWL